MIKIVVLTLIVFNASTDEEKVINLPYSNMNECLYNEAMMYVHDSAMQIELINNNIELIESFCE